MAVALEAVDELGVAPGEPLPGTAARLSLKSHEVLRGGAIWLRYRISAR